MDTRELGPELGPVERAIDEALAHLKAREERIIRLYYGLYDEKPMTLAGIMAMIGANRYRVVTMRDKALKRLENLPRTNPDLNIVAEIKAMR